MGAIFKTMADDQQESMMKTIHIGNTWEFRYFKIKAWLYATIIVLATNGVTMGVDYAIFKFTEQSGIIGWLLG